MGPEPERGQERQRDPPQMGHMHTYPFFHSGGSRVWRGFLPLILALEKFLNLWQHCGAQVQLPQGAGEKAGCDAISQP